MVEETSWHHGKKKKIPVWLVPGALHTHRNIHNFYLHGNLKTLDSLKPLNTDLILLHYYNLLTPKPFLLEMHQFTVVNEQEILALARGLQETQ